MVPADPDTFSGKAYFPFTGGTYAEYEVDSTVYTEIPRDTLIFRYRLKVKVADHFIDNEGREAFRLERYVKWFSPVQSYDSMSWRLKEVWLLLPGDRRMVVNESNVLYTKMTFPVQDKASWDGNAMNSGGEQIYYYEYVDRAEKIGTKNFDKVLMVNQQEKVTLISEDVAYEKYAFNVGLAERSVKHIKGNNVVPGKAVTDRIESGTVYHQTIVSYGRE